MGFIDIQAVHFLVHQNVMQTCYCGIQIFTSAVNSHPRTQGTKKANYLIMCLNIQHSETAVLSDYKIC